MKVAAVSVDPSAETEKLRQKRGYTFLFLSDTDAQVIRKWDLLHARGGPNGTDIARPAEFLIDPSGTVRWVNLTEDYRVRLKAAEALKVLDELHVGRSYR